jgi:hypothetical protein
MAYYLLKKKNTAPPHDHILTEDGEKVQIEGADRLISELPSLSGSSATIGGGTSDEYLPISVGSLTTGTTYKTSLPELTTSLSPAASTGYLKNILKLDGSEEVAVVQDGQLKRVKSAALGAGERLNVKELGARGDGLTNMAADDTRAIQDALKAVHNIPLCPYSNELYWKEILPPGATMPEEIGHVEIFFPPGWYVISSQLVIETLGHVRLRGAGPDYTTLMLGGLVPSPVTAYDATLTFTLGKQNRYDARYSVGCGLSGMTILAGDSRFALRLDRQAYFHLKDVRLESHQVALAVTDCADNRFANARLKCLSGGAESALRPSSLHLINSTGQTFDNVVLEGAGDGARIEGGSTFFYGCCFRDNTGKGLSFGHQVKSGSPEDTRPTGIVTPTTSGESPLASGDEVSETTLGPPPVVSISRCRFERNGGGAVYQESYPVTMPLPRPATVWITDSSLHGADEGVTEVSGPSPFQNLIEVNNCDLDIRSSPATGGRYDYYLALPDYRIERFRPDPMVTVHVENHQHMPGGGRILDPAGVVTGTVHSLETGQVLDSRAVIVTPYLETQTARALMVEAPDDRNPYHSFDEIREADTDSGWGKKAWDFRVDLEQGGIKVLYLNQVLGKKGFNASTDLCTLKFRNPAAKEDHNLRPVAGQELDLLLVNQKGPVTPATLTFQLPECFLTHQGGSVVLSPGESRMTSFVFLDRILLIRLKRSAGIHLGNIIEDTDLMVRVDVDTRPQDGWGKVMATGKVIRKTTNVLFDLLYLELDEGGAALDMQNLAKRWQQYAQYGWLGDITIKLTDSGGGNEIPVFSGAADKDSSDFQMVAEEAFLFGCWVQTR